MSDILSNQQIGLRLLLASAGLALPLRLWGSTTIYQIQHGDTLSHLANKHIGGPIYHKKNGSLQKLLALNPQIANPNKIWAGQKVNLPKQDDIDLKNNLVYRVKKGDNLSSIAYQNLGKPLYGVEKTTIKLLLKENPQIANPDRLEIGQLLTLPSIHKLVSYFEESFAPKERMGPHRTLAAIQEATVVETRKAEAVKERDYKNSDISAGLRYFSRSVKGSEKLNNTQSELNSDQSIGLELRWSHIWSNYFRTHLFFDWQYYNYDQPDNNDRLEKNKIAATSYGLRGEYNLTEKFTLGASLSLADKIFYQRTSLNTLRLERDIFPKAEVQGSYLIHKGEKIAIEALGAINILGDGKDQLQNAKGSAGYFGGLRFHYPTNWGSLTAETYYQTQKIETNFVEQKEQDIGVLLFHNIDF